MLGDARLSLQAMPAGSFDLLILDGFSSDAIPVHLLTAEAMALYLDKLAPGGAIALHVSNGNLDLAPVVAALVRGRRGGLAADPSAGGARRRCRARLPQCVKLDRDRASQGGPRRARRR